MLNVIFFLVASQNMDADVSPYESCSGTVPLEISYKPKSTLCGPKLSGILVWASFIMTFIVIHVI